MRIHKKHIVGKLAVLQNGAIKADQLRIPDDAAWIAKIKATAMRTNLLPTDVPFQVPKYFHGSGTANETSPAFVLGLVFGEYVNNQPEFQVTAGPSDYVYYAYPASMVLPTPVFNTFVGGFLPPVSVQLTIGGESIAYRLIRSTNANLSTVSIRMIHGS